MAKQINVARAHIFSGAQTYGKRSEADYYSRTTRGVRVPLTRRAKKLLGIPADSLAFVMLVIEQPPVNTAVDRIATQLLTPGDPIYDPKKG